jgi:hypothetical protein
MAGPPVEIEQHKINQFNLPNQGKKRRNTMFKKLATFAVAAVMSLSASSAFAAFANLDVIRVISDKTAGSTVEIVTNLGNVNTISALSNSVVGGSFTGFTTSALSNLSVTYFAVDRTTVLNGTMWIASTISSPAPVTPGVAQIQNKLATTGGVANNPTLVYYNTLGAGQTVVANNTNTASLAGKFGTTTLGNYAGYAVNFATTTNMSLANLASAPLTMTLWKFGNSTNMGVAATGVKALTLTLNSDGTTTVNASAPVTTPIPAAAWLLGSGLMGLVGLRRRKNA